MVYSNGRSGSGNHLFPHERWAASHADRFLPRKATSTPERLEQSVGTTAFVLYIASRKDLRVAQVTELTIVVVAAVMYAVTRAGGGPVASDRHPYPGAVVATVVVFWALVLLGVFSLVLFSVRSSQSLRERRRSAG